MTDRHRVLRIGVSGGVVVLAVGLALWLTASSGSKQAALGTALIAALVPGAVLLVVQQSFQQLVERQATNYALASSGQPIEEEDHLPAPAPLEVPIPLVAEEHEAEEAPAPRRPTGRFDVEYVGRQRDPSRIDAMQARLRVFRNGDYFQFVVAIAAGPDLRLLGKASMTSNEAFWRAFSEGAGRIVEQEISAGALPLPDATKAFEVFPSVEEAIRQARHGAEVVEGDVVHTFEF